MIASRQERRELARQEIGKMIDANLRGLSRKQRRIVERELVRANWKQCVKAKDELASPGRAR